MSTVAEALRRGNPVTEWLAFFSQMIIAVSVEVGDDLGRGMFSQHGTTVGIDNARSVAGFEQAHGFFFEPAWQMFFEQSHRFLVFTLTWAESVRIMNGIYILGHVCVTLAVALWVYFHRRPMFGLLRNTVILVNLFALFIYERFPVAPPRLTSGLSFNHHAFVFQDTVYGVLNGSGKLLGTGVGYNEFSAMPSVHMAWAMVVGGALIWLARPWAVKLLGVVYPCLMLLAVVVTGNHYLLDVIVAVPVVMAAVLASLALDQWWKGLQRRRAISPVT